MRDIYRWSDPKQDFRNGRVNIDNPNILYSLYQKCGKCSVKKLYASEGETGIIKEVFAAEKDHRWQRNKYHVKVIMDNDNSIKTFRQTSVKKIS